MCIDHILFIHSSFDGYLGYFHLLAVVMNIGVQIFAWDSAFHYSVYIPRTGIDGSYSKFYITFWGTTKLFSTVSAPIYIYTSNAHIFWFLTSLPTLILFCFLVFILFCFLIIAIPMDMMWYLSVALIYISLIIREISCACWSFVYLPLRNVYSSLCSF